MTSVPHRVWIWAASLSVLLVVAQYFQANFRYPLLDSTDALTLTGFLNGGTNFEEQEECMPINVAKEKTVVWERDEFGDTVGSIAITNRLVLLELLRFIHDTDYKYVFLDVRMEDGLQTPHDSALFALINSMPRIVVSRHSSETGITNDSRIKQSKTAIADYFYAVTDGFSRYQFLHPEGESVAHRMYRNIIGDSVFESAILYFDSHNNRLCNNLAFVPLPLTAKVAKNSVADDGVIRYPYPRTTLRLNYTPDELRERMAGKIVIIGDFDNDVHQTYIGDVPGPMLHYYAYKALVNSRHIINVWVTLALLILYFVILLNLFSPGLFSLFRFNLHPVLIFIIAIIGWNTVLLITKVVCYCLTGVSVHMLFPSMLFSGIVFWNTFTKHLHEGDNPQHSQSADK